ncbi:sodium/solute symporter family protein [mine drainage metagenome]|uniref:Sodium/solute symporter family protein n=1 Tax=mine drainage metagenome TaxID=410659 RepID=T1A4M0_9ZZZZ
MNIAVAILIAVWLFVLVLGLLARRGRVMNLEQWTVGRRGFGGLLIFFLLAGEIYTTFTFLGASGWAYGYGGVSYYIIAYGALAYGLGYWLLPPIWRYAQERKLYSQTDFFVAQYGSRALGAGVAVVGILAMFPYLALQLEGLGLIVEVTTGGRIGALPAVLLGTFALTLYVMISGIRAAAWTAAIKDVSLLLVVLFLGLYLPFHASGGVGPMFHEIARRMPHFLKLPHTGKNAIWFSSTVLLSVLGFYLWPHTFGSVYAARDADLFRKNAIVLPLYQLILLFVFLGGFAALVLLPGLHDHDLALLAAAAQSLPAWVLGLIGGAGLLAALVPGSMLLLAIATQLARNLIGFGLAGWDEEKLNLLARALVPLIALSAIAFEWLSGKGIVVLLLLGYGFVTQLLPALLASLLPRNPVSAPAVWVGAGAGVGVVVLLYFGGPRVHTLLEGLPLPWRDMNYGILALILNALLMLAVTALSRLRAGRPPLLLDAGRS